MSIEEEWRRGRFFGTRQPIRSFGDPRPDRFLCRSDWVIDGTDRLATESPAHVEFPAAIQQLIGRIRHSAALHRKANEIGERGGFDPDKLISLLSAGQIDLLREAIEYCRSRNISSAFFEPTSADTQFFEQLGVIAFCAYDSGETYYTINPLLFGLRL